MGSKTMMGVVLAVAMAAFGCTPLVLGNGAVVEELRSVPEFTRGLRAESWLDVRYREGPPSVLVRTDSNVQGYIETVVEDGVLILRRAEGVEFIAAKKELEISGPVLPSFEAASAATLDLALPPLDALELSAQSSARVSATGLSVRQLKLVADSASTATVTGELSTLEVESLASSTVDTTGATAARAQVTASGSAVLKVRASEEVSGVSTSSSRVDIYGRPRVANVVASSSGVVTFAE